MTDPVPSKEQLNFSWTWDVDARTWRISMFNMGDGLLAGYDHLAGYYERRLIEEIERLQGELQQMKEDWATICAAADAMPAYEPPAVTNDQIEILFDALDHNPFKCEYEVVRRWLGTIGASQPPGDHS